MITTSFNSGWTAGAAASAFASILGGAPSVRTEVTLPYDAIRDLERSADSDQGSHTGYFPGGVFEYSKTFDAPADWATKSVVLEFEGVYRGAVVRVNGDLAAHRPSGYAGFTVDIGPHLVFGGSNVITVVSVADEDSRWYTGAGIYRNTWLHVGAHVHVAPRGVRVTTPEVEPALAVVEAEVRVVNITRTTRTVRVSTRIVGASGEVARATTPVTVLAGGTEIARLRHYVTDPGLWSVDAPVLYRIETALLDGESVIDEHSTNFGIRRLQLDPVHGLRINGETIKMRGACIHHDNGPLGSAAISRAEERRVELLKAAGYNAIRSAHNPISRATLEACDRLGMLVMDELTDIWTEPKTPYDYSHSFPEWWERDLESMVAKDFNHPSVVMYSIGNEIQETGRPLGARWGRLLAEKVRSLDNTRYVTNAINSLFAVPSAFADVPDGGNVNDLMASLGDALNHVSASDEVSAKTEESFGVLDIAGVNYGESRYELDRDVFPNRILVGSETFPGHLDVLWPLVRDNPQVIGDFAWTGWDYLGEAGLGRQGYTDDTIRSSGMTTAYPWLTASSGTIDITGHRRPISYWRETIWGLRTEPYLTVLRPEDHGRTPVIGPWSWRDSVSSWTWDVAPGAPISVEVYSDADEVELHVNGGVVDRAPVGAEKACLVRFETTYEPGEIVAVAFTGGVEQSRTSLRTASDELRIALTADKTEVRAGDEDLAYVDIVLQDMTGNLANHRDRSVSVVVTGPGTLAALGSARPDSTESFGAGSRTTFDGRALAIIRPTGLGTISVVVSAEGLADATIEVTAG
jgi:hypothetical protein